VHVTRESLKYHHAFSLILTHFCITLFIVCFTKSKKSIQHKEKKSRFNSKSSPHVSNKKKSHSSFSLFSIPIRKTFLLSFFSLFFNIYGFHFSFIYFSIKKFLHYFYFISLNFNYWDLDIIKLIVVFRILIFLLGF
jgi:hypothetical protein